MMKKPAKTPAKRPKNNRRVTNASLLSTLEVIDKNIKTRFRQTIQQIETLGRPGASGGTDDRLIGVLREELQNMNTHIASTKAEVAALKPQDSNEDDHITAAANELDAVVKSTEAATSDILQAAENIQEMVDALREDRRKKAFKELDSHLDALEAEGLNIVMACGFQDLTGQRITKVVNTLGYIEERINTLINVWGIETGTSASGLIAHAKNDARSEKHLLHGPQTDGAGVSQDDIDALFD